MPLLHSHITRFGMRPQTGSFPAVKCPYYETQREGYTVQEMNQSMTVHLVSSPDLIRRVYCFQYNARVILKATRAGVGFGSGTETTVHYTQFLCYARRSF